MEWYYVEAGQQVGPVDDAALAALAASGTVTSGTLIWREGMPEWQPCSQANPSILRTAAVPVAAPVASGPAPGVGEAVCAECGGIFPLNDTIALGNARVCAQCKPVAVQKMREGLEVVPHGALKYAGFWIRFAAKFLDGLILAIAILVPVFIVFFMIGAARGSAGGAQRNPGLGIILQLIVQFGSLVVTVLYSGFFLGKYGATPGKMACNIKVVSPEGQKISYGLAFGRSLAEILSRLICSIGYIMAAFDEEKRALHDRMCNTRVVYR